MKDSELSLEPEPAPPKPYWFGRILAVVAFAFTAVVVILELAGILRELGEILTVVGTGLGFFALITTATREQIQRLEFVVLIEGARTRNPQAVQGQAVLAKLDEILQELRKK